MILTYKECINKYGSDYMIKKEINAGNLVREDRGIYSSDKKCSELEIVTSKYPKAIISGESAYFYHGLTDVIPEYYVLAIKRSETRIKDKRVKQLFVNDNLFEKEKTKIYHNGVSINIYSRERLLVDLIRFKHNYPFDFYKEVIGSYREIADKLDFFAIESYASEFRTCRSIMKSIQLEVL